MEWQHTGLRNLFQRILDGKLGSEDAFNKALQDGVKEDAATTGGGGAFSGGEVAAATTAIEGYRKASGTEVVLYQKVSIGTGTQASNPWLQELPDPVSKATWDNYALISMKKADELGIKLNTDYEYYPEKPVIKFTIGKTEFELPILVIPGMNADTIAIAVGYGRNEGMGVTAAGVGKNVYPFTTFNGITVDYHVDDVSAVNNKTGYTIKLRKHKNIILTKTVKK